MNITVFICLFLIILALVSYILRIKRYHRHVSEVLKDICGGNRNRRFYFMTSDKMIQKLNSDFNSLMNRYEEILEKKQYLEESRKKMISDISHDIRTPLTSLLGYIEALQTDRSLSDEEREKYTGIIASRGQKLYDLVQDFFEMSRLESDDSPIMLQRLDICEKIRETLASNYHDFARADMEPDIQLPRDPLYVLCDHTSLDRVLNNLLSNTLRYGADGGVFGIALREERDRVWVDIWDHGKGIPQKDLPHIFERLYTAEPSRNEKMRGSGLGLSIARKLVEKQNGEITVTSIPGDKTTFAFYLMKDVQL